ncbi:MAG: ABC transporter permease [Bdellovibrionia bacterium]
MELLILVVQVIASTFRVSTPLLFGALGGLMSERAGVINIALEGMMLMGAFGASVTASSTQSATLGFLGAMGFALGLALLYGFFAIELQVNQIVAGTAMNMLAAGITPFLCKVLYDSSTSTPSLPLAVRAQTAPILMAWGLPFVIWFWLKKTPSGLWVRFAGENPEALDAAGIRVKRVRWVAVACSGILAGLGGASLSIFLSSSFSRNMTAGRGFMALAALIFGKWRPIPTAVACLLFGLLDSLQIRLQGVVFWGQTSVPVQLIQVLPYLVTLLVLAGIVGKAKAPQALGVPFMKS